MVCSGTLRSSFVQEFEFSGYASDAEFGACCTGCCCCVCSNAQIHREFVLRNAPPLHPLSGGVRPSRPLTNGMMMTGNVEDGDEDEKGKKGGKVVNERSRLLAQS